MILALGAKIHWHAKCLGILHRLLFERLHSIEVSKLLRLHEGIVLRIHEVSSVVRHQGVHRHLLIQFTACTADVNSWFRVIELETHLGLDGVIVTWLVVLRFGHVLKVDLNVLIGCLADWVVCLMFRQIGRLDIL